ncbi:MAG: DUF1592 domain-containing protein [Pirellulaceae bacterium]
MKTILTIALLFVPTLAFAQDDLAAIAPLVQTYCVGCHGPEVQKGDVRLDHLDSLDAATFETVYEQLAGGLMPPDDKPRPTTEQLGTLTKQVLELAKMGASVTAPGLRRLNKREYGNTVRDLLGLRMGVFDPSEYIYDDEIDEGFDTSAESLVISNELLIEYMGAAEKSLRHALFTAETNKPAPQVTNVNIKRMKGIGGNRYLNNHADHIICRCGGKAMVFDGQSTRTIKLPGRYTVTVTAAAVDRDSYPVRFVPERGPVIMGYGVKQDVDTSVTAKPRLQKTFELKDEIDQTFTFDTWIDRDHFPYFSFVNGPGKPITQVRSNVRRRKLEPSEIKKPYRGPGIRISQFKIEGPFIDQWPPESIRTTFDSAELPDLNDPRQRLFLLGRFARRAFRRNVTRDEMAPWVDYMNKLAAEAGAGSRAGDANTTAWHAAVVKTFAAMMSSVDFLYIREQPGRLDDFTLANRLSYFLWSTMPDAELFALARSGKLSEATILQQQVTRLLADPRSARFSDSFADQWLSLDELGSMPPDVKSKEFKDYFRDKLEPAMLEETRRFVRHVLQENRSVRDFIDSDYSFINKGLAKLYGVPFGGNDGKFVRVTFPANASRGGLLGHASILTLTANGVETSPVERGVWVLADLLGTPPPPPPKEVPALTPDLNGAETVRELLEKHRSDSACMECHRRMDPLGFALESYDPIGRFRTTYSKTQKVSTEGNFLGTDFADITELKQILANDIRPFARSLVIRIAEYAKGRKLIAADYTTVESILAATEDDGFKLNDLVSMMATSDLMTSR